MKKLLIVILAVLSAFITSCNRQQQDAAPSWDAKLDSMMPYLGHRNWIVVADMAYPLQSGSGITTLYADEPYEQVVAKVKGLVDKYPHVFAHVYNDAELSYISEKDMPGVDALRAKMKEICGDEVVSVRHEDLIARLDEAGKLYSVVIIKTPLTMAYTTTFFELDCKYWGPQKQSVLDAAMSAAQ